MQRFALGKGLISFPVVSGSLRSEVSRSPSATAASMMAGLLTSRRKPTTASVVVQETQQTSTNMSSRTGRASKGRRSHHHPVAAVAAPTNRIDFTVMEPFEGDALALDPPGTQVPGERFVIDKLEGAVEAFSRRHSRWRVAMKRYDQEAAATRMRLSQIDIATTTPTTVTTVASGELDASDLFDIMEDSAPEGVPSPPVSDKQPSMSETGSHSASTVNTLSNEPHRTLPPPPEEPTRPTLPTTVLYCCRGCRTPLFMGSVEINLKPSPGTPFVSIQESNTLTAEQERKLKASRSAESGHATTNKHNLQERLDSFMDTLEAVKKPYPQFRFSVGGNAIVLGTQSVEVEYATAETLLEEENEEQGGEDAMVPLHTLRQFDISRRIKQREDKLERLVKKAKATPFMTVSELKRDYNSPNLTYAETQRNRRLFKAALRQDAAHSTSVYDNRFPGMCTRCNRVVCVVSSSTKGGFIVNPTSVECRLDEDE